MCRLSQISREDIYTYELHDLIFQPHFLWRHVYNFTRSHRSHLAYTDFLRLVEVAAESKRGASIHGQKKCTIAGRPKVTVTLVNRLSQAVTREKAPHQWSIDELARGLYLRETCISPLSASQSPCCNPLDIYDITCVPRLSQRRTLCQTTEDNLRPLEFQRHLTCWYWS
jgi:hypothetical protein